MSSVAVEWALRRYGFVRAKQRAGRSARHFFSPAAARLISRGVG
jgi:hypothetical protein